MRALIASLTLLSAPCFVVDAPTQGLGDAAKQEQGSRDKAVKKRTTSQVYTGTDLLETRSQVPPASAAPQLSSKASAGSTSGTSPAAGIQGPVSGSGSGPGLQPRPRPRPSPRPSPRPTPSPTPKPAPAPTPAPTPTPSPPPPLVGAWVSGYYAGWFWDWHPSPGDAVAAVDMSTITHFIFGRYAPGAGTLGGAAGQIVQGAGSGHASVEDALIARAHAAGTRALAMLGGAGDGPGFVASTAPAVRGTFIKNVLDKCVAKNYDGVDVDWEDSLDTATQRNQLIAFLTELRAAAAQRPRYQAPNAPFIITFPGYYVNTNTDLPLAAWHVTVASLVDQYNLMSYSMTWNCCGWDSWLWAALKDAGPTHPTSIESSIQAYVDAGVPRNKMGMGLGLYSSGYASPVSGPRQPISTHYMWADYEATWAHLYRSGLLSQANYRFDSAAQAGYYSHSSPVTFLGNWVSTIITEDLQSIAAKGAWAKAGNCGGTIVWTINYGYVDAAVGNPPMQAVKQAFR